MKKDNIIIAGPCALENDEQIKISIDETKKRNIDFMRMPLWKPRTKPGFEGLGKDGINFLIDAAKQGINPATEVLTAEQAEFVVDKIFNTVSNTKLMLWLGSRNQNHFIQRDIAKIAEKNKNITLMIKNQPWHSQDHWEGIVSHVLESGIDKERVLICHRGFFPSIENNSGYRNIPDFKMAMDVKKNFDLKMILDPSHIGGSTENVKKIINESINYDFDGLIIEVHPNPLNAQTDAKQQLTWDQFDNLFI